MADMAGLQWATLGALLALLYLDVGVRSAKLGLLTGVCIGLASLTRYIYFHGTNQESLLGTPASIGCIRLANADIVALHDRVREGDLVVIVASGVERS